MKIVQKTDTHLFTVVSNGLQDCPERGNGDSNVQQVGTEEEIIEVSKNGKRKVPKIVQERLKKESKSERVREREKTINTYVIRDRDTDLPNLILPVNSCDEREWSTRSTTIR